MIPRPAVSRPVPHPSTGVMRQLRGRAAQQAIIPAAQYVAPASEARATWNTLPSGAGAQGWSTWHIDRGRTAGGFSVAWTRTGSTVIGLKQAPLRVHQGDGVFTQDGLDGIGIGVQQRLKLRLPVLFAEAYPYRNAEVHLQARL